MIYSFNFKSESSLDCAQPGIDWVYSQTPLTADDMYWIYYGATGLRGKLSDSIPKTVQFVKLGRGKSGVYYMKRHVGR